MRPCCHIIGQPAESLALDQRRQANRPPGQSARRRHSRRDSFDHGLKRTALLPHDTNASTASPWRPLGVPLFRNLLFADVLSDVGTFMQSVGAAWLMVSLRAGPTYVALTQTAS